jgi:hypothetical protein
MNGLFSFAQRDKQISPIRGLLHDLAVVCDVYGVGVVFGQRDNVGRSADNRQVPRAVGWSVKIIRSIGSRRSDN